MNPKAVGMKTTLVIGASTNPARYSYKAINRLRDIGHPVYALGLRSGKVNDVFIETIWNPDWKVDTVTLYINPSLQEQYFDKILALKPVRVIFNPGTENKTFVDLLKSNGIDSEYACTLVLLAIDEY